MDEQLHRVLIKHPFHTVTVVLVILALVQSVALLTQDRPAPAAASPTPPPTQQPAGPKPRGLLLELHKLGLLEHPSPTQRIVLDDRQLDGKTIEAKTTGAVRADIDLAALSEKDITVRPDGVATVTLPGMTVSVAGNPRQQYRVPGTTQDWADITSQAVSQYPGLDRFAHDEQAQLISDVGITCASAYWAQQIVAQRTQAAGFAAVIVHVEGSC